MPTDLKKGFSGVLDSILGGSVGLENYKIESYRQDDGSWVAEIPSIPGCYALMPTLEESLAELAVVFRMIADEYREEDRPLPRDTAEIVHP